MRRSALALLLGCLLLVAGASALDGYDYYQIIEYAGCDQDVYQQDIVIHRSTGTAYNETAGGLETWHIYVGEHCQADYDDVRFTNSTGDLAYYLWPDYNSSSARFAVRLEGAAAAGVATIWYGNAAATTTSDGDATYLLFDHFEGSSLNSGLWDVVGSAAVSGSQVHVSGASAYRIVRSRSAYPVDTRMEIRGSISSQAAGSDGFGYKNLENIQRVDLYMGWPATNQMNAITMTSSYSSQAVGWRSGTHTYAIERRGTSGATYFADGSQIASISTNIPTIDLLADIRSYSSGVTVSVDWILVRAYSATPPAATTFSGEQETAGLQPFPGLTNIPRDLAGTGLYTDINGNGRLDYNDLTVFFQHLAWAKTAQPIACFDFNGNGWLDYNDVITLFSTIMEEHT